MKIEKEREIERQRKEKGGLRERRAGKAESEDKGDREMRNGD